MAQTLLINQADARRLLSMDICIAAMKETLRDIAAGSTTTLQRMMIPQLEGNNFAMMGCTNLAQKLCGAKIIVFPGAAAKAAHTNQGVVPLFDSETGSLLAIVDAECITAVRTAATSAAATDILARPDATTMAVLGAGRIGRLHIEAILKVRDIHTVYVWNRTPQRAEECCHWAAETFGITAIPCNEAKQAVQNADIVSTITQAREPVLLGSWLKPGAHINAVGACTPSSRELDTEAVLRSRVYTDWQPAALRDGGDLAIPLAAGDITPQHILGDVGQVLLGQLPGRSGNEEITLFESVGIAVEDLAAAALIYQRAKQEGLGTPFQF